MAAADLTVLQPHLIAVDLDRSFQLEAAGAPIQHVYFPESGVASIVSHLPNGREIEVGIVGREGMTGCAVLLGAGQSPNLTIMRLDGRGQRLPASILVQAMATSAALKAFLFLYAQSVMVQTASSILANGHVQIDGRLSRWLLMAHDRVGGDEVHLTHQLLSLTLGVTRPSLTGALHALEGLKLIRSSRGRVILLDRPGLILAAEGSYGAAESEYSRLIGARLSPHPKV